MPLQHPVAPEPMDEKTAYQRGYDYGQNGANDTNCSYSIFVNSSFKEAWERGRDAAKADSNEQD